MNPYHTLANDYARLLKAGRTFPLGSFAPLPKPEPTAGAPNVLIFSPHPDDEVIVGGLALRLMREARWPVTNVAVTQGSNKDRFAGRLEEVKQCCNFIGFNLVQTAPNGLERNKTITREQDPAHWAKSVQIIAAILEQYKPRVIFFPHKDDWNSGHIATHYLLVDALKSLPPGYQCFTVETEFWGAMDNPNLMVEFCPDHVADLMTALTFHKGEVSRNPYHLSLPAWMIDNVRRGSELVGGQGGAAADFAFATLYRLRKWSQGRWDPIWTGGKYLPCDSNAGELFPI